MIFEGTPSRRWSINFSSNGKYTNSLLFFSYKYEMVFSWALRLNIVEDSKCMHINWDAGKILELQAKLSIEFDVLLAYFYASPVMSNNH